MQGPTALLLPRGEPWSFTAAYAQRKYISYRNATARSRLRTFADSTISSKSQEFNDKLTWKANASEREAPRQPASMPIG